MQSIPVDVCRRVAFLLRWRRSPRSRRSEMRRKDTTRAATAEPSGCAESGSENGARNPHFGRQIDSGRQRWPSDRARSEDGDDPGVVIATGGSRLGRKTGRLWPEGRLTGERPSATDLDLGGYGDHEQIPIRPENAFTTRVATAPRSGAGGPKPLAPGPCRPTAVPAPPNTVWPRSGRGREPAAKTGSWPRPSSDQALG